MRGQGEGNVIGGGVFPISSIFMIFTRLVIFGNLFPSWDVSSCERRIHEISPDIPIRPDLGSLGDSILDRGPLDGCERRPPLPASGCARRSPDDCASALAPHERSHHAPSLLALRATSGSYN